MARQTAALVVITPLQKIQPTRTSPAIIQAPAPVAGISAISPTDAEQPSISSTISRTFERPHARFAQKVLVRLPTAVAAPIVATASASPASVVPGASLKVFLRITLIAPALIPVNITGISVQEASSRA